MEELQDRTKTPYLKDTFKIGYDAFEKSRQEAAITWEFYHNRQWTQAQLSKLLDRGQPQETFNIVKLFSRLLVGYYSTTVNKIQAQPVASEDAVTTALINDLLD